MKDIKTDYLGQELNIGDKVVFMQVKYRGLMTGVIQSMSNKTAIISHEKTNLCTTETRQFYGQIIKHPKETLTT